MLAVDPESREPRTASRPIWHGCCISSLRRKKTAKNVGAKEPRRSDFLVTYWETEMMNTNSALVQMNRLRDELDRVFGVDTSAWTRAISHPPVNVWEDDNNLYLEAEVPGLVMDDLEIYVHDGDELSIKGVRREKEIHEGKWRRQERSYGEFSRSFKLAGDFDVENVSAELKHGLLTITLPKSEAVKPRKIEVRSSE